MIEDLQVGARFLARLPRFLRSPVSVEEARRRLEQRLRTRHDRLVALLDEIGAGPADSPYARLMSACGCSVEDARQLVLDEGVEGALGRLLDAGVCLDNHRGTKGDTFFTLESLPAVIGEAIRGNKLVVWRHVPGDGGYNDDDEDDEGDDW